jgi:replicative DNA helicase Mcm
MTATESAYASQIALKLLDQMPETISKLRPNSTFTYEMDSDDFAIFAEHPKKIEYIYHRAVVETCKEFWYDFKYRNCEGTEKKQMISKDKQNEWSSGLENFDKIKVKLIFYKTIEMRDIGPKIEKEPIVLEGRIMAVSDKRGYLKEGLVFCPNHCNEGEDMIFAGPTLRSYIPKCPTCKTKMHLRTSTAVTDYVQTIKLQELDAGTNRKPIDFDVKVIGDDVFNTWIGKRVRIAGHFLTDIVMTGNQQEHKQFIFAKYMHEIEEVQNICLTRERAEEIRTQLQTLENQKRLWKSFAPDIEGKILQKETLMYAFVGGSESEVRRIDINALEIGNAGQGKSELIKQVPRVIAKSKYVLANNATSAGLGIGMVKLDNQTSVPQGGPLVMCSPHGVLALDELDKMHAEDIKSLLSSMENQIVTKTVAGVDLVLPSKVVIVAAANPKWGQWDEAHGVVENINFPAYLLTRFDIISCSVKTNAIQKQEIANKILGLEPVTNEAKITPLLSEEELMQYLNYCKKFQPKLTYEAKVMLNDFYQQMSEITKGEDKVVPLTPRELEGMIRLTTARAKLLQKNEAGIEDVKAIMELKKEAMSTFPGIKIEQAGQQLNLLSEMDKKDKSKEDVIISCLDEDRKVASEDVIKGWLEEGVFKSESRAEREFQSMIGGRFFLRGSRYLYK